MIKDHLLAWIRIFLFGVEGPGLNQLILLLITMADFQIISSLGIVYGME